MDPNDTTFPYRWLDEQDARCPKCKYHLRGVRSRECPECGYQLLLERRDEIDWWAAGVFGTAPIFILNMAVFLLLIASVGMKVRGGLFSASMQACIVILCSVLAVQHLRRRDAFSRSEAWRVRRQTVTLLTFSMTAAAIGVVMAVRLVA